MNTTLTDIIPDQNIKYYKVNVRETSIYKEYLALKEEVNKHKWYESEKAGKDIGWAQALIDWTLKFKSKWIEQRKKH